LENTIIKYFLTLIFPAMLYSQNELVGNFNSCHSGRTIDLIYNIKIKEKSKMGIGVLFNLKTQFMNGDQQDFFKKRLYPSNFKECFGLHFYYLNYFKNTTSTLKWFWFADTQLKHSKTKNRGYTVLIDTIENPLQYLVYYQSNWGPFTWLQTSIGFGMDLPLNKRFSLTQKIGQGLEFIRGYDKELLFTYDNKINWEFAFIYNVGLVYKLK
jgi:hypothetical protein